jgi:hypothetical protein
MTTGISDSSVPNGSLHVVLLREMWCEFFTIVLDSGYTEELDPEETRAWFRVRGADMDRMEKALDQTWNFGRCEVEIENPKTPRVTRLPHSPDV